MRPWVLTLTLLGGCSFGIVRTRPTPATAAEPASCRSYGWVVPDVLGGAAAAMGGLLAANPSCTDCEGSMADPQLAIALLSAAAVLGVSALYALVANTTCRINLDETPAPPEPSVANNAMRRTQAREEARRLHLEAVKEANAGNCAVVRGRDIQVRELDAEYHAIVFLRDVAIQRCLAVPTS